MASPTFFKERKSFIFRVIDKEFHGDIKWSREQLIAKFLFKKYPVDFLSKVAPPFKMNSIVWFRSNKGQEYLSRKFREFNYHLPETEEIKEIKEKVGEDVDIKKKTLFKFLNE